MNAVLHLASPLSRDVFLRLLGARRRRAGQDDLERLRSRALRPFELDLAAFLNALRAAELRRVAAEAGVDDRGGVGELRLRLWLFGAELEAGGQDALGAPWQPLPILLGGKLALLGPERGISPPAPALPRPVPPASVAPRLEDEPESVEELFERANRLLGVRLGRRGRDKGAYGSRIAALLGVPEGGHSEPDWRGEVELKTVPVARDRSGFWRVVEDPAVSMEHASPLSKLARVLWIARVADDGSAPVLSWYYQEWDREVAAMVARHLHRRPKGGAGATTRGWYLQKRFFIESGFLRSLNG